VQPDVLRQAISDVVNRHEVLRTTFELVDASPMQRINDVLPTELNFVSLQSVVPQVRAATWVHAASKVLQRPFDLRKCPLLRNVLYQLVEDDNILFSVMHHIVCDAWSVSIFARELKACYDARAMGCGRRRSFTARASLHALFWGKGGASRHPWPSLN
jgi:NRPS condensation-like uncharacterized protein